MEGLRAFIEAHHDALKTLLFLPHSERQTITEEISVADFEPFLNNPVDIVQRLKTNFQAEKQVELSMYLVLHDKAAELYKTPGTDTATKIRYVKFLYTFAMAYYKALTDRYKEDFELDQEAINDLLRSVNDTGVSGRGGGGFSRKASSFRVARNRTASRAHGTAHPTTHP